MEFVCVLVILLFCNRNFFVVKFFNSFFLFLFVEISVGDDFDKLVL